MNQIIQTLSLAIVQGITEFIPVSSSAHLILLPKLLGWSDQGLAMDVAMHLGTLGAVIIYYRQDLWALLNEIQPKNWQWPLNVEQKLFAYITFATIPVGLCGLLFNQYIQTYFRSEKTIGLASLFFAIILALSNYGNNKQRDLKEINHINVLAIALAQCLALIPGASRSGVTLSAGLFCKLNIQAAAKFSFLLSIPVVALAGLHQSYHLYQQPSLVLQQWPYLILGTIAAFGVGLASIKISLSIFKRFGLTPFVVYRLLLSLYIIFR